MDRGAWRATAQGAPKESGTTQEPNNNNEPGVCVSASTFQLTPFASWCPYICSLGLDSLFTIGKSSSNSPHRFPLTAQSQDLCQEQYLRDCLGPIPILPWCWAHFSQPKSRFNQHERKRVTCRASISVHHCFHISSGSAKGSVKWLWKSTGVGVKWKGKYILDKMGHS